MFLSNSLCEYLSVNGEGRVKDGSGDTVWVKSSISDVTDDCVEVAHCDHEILVRDSKTQDSKFVAFSIFAWNAFIATAAEGSGTRRH
ncbi:DUF397 domain-containing protein [Streptomyces sp. SID14446]|uniref:DUF397 domain-containing protein n=1 Tax=Streptomyces sp. SID14446 TaxID=2706072 RepID=UPI0013B78DF3|nr:DUF397 domain-containing protein [Streptomyces sp. SID14446]NEB32803.1 DUF397 domain-containing protein [Streptomyces sp. SID14446]